MEATATRSALPFADIEPGTFHLWSAGFFRKCLVYVSDAGIHAGWPVHAYFVLERTLYRDDEGPLLVICDTTPIVPCFDYDPRPEIFLATLNPTDGSLATLKLTREGDQCHIEIRVGRRTVAKFTVEPKEAKT